MKIKMAYCCLLNVFVYLTSFTQEQKITPVSPEAAALAKMVNYPINLNTGVPDISIPLYTINTGGMVLPITLQYHAGGFNINEHSARTGLGWSLSCDLQITRAINGLDDFNDYIYNSKIKSHYPGNFSYPFSGPNYEWKNALLLSTGEEDGMPDKFNYKLLNKAGSFYFRKDDYGTGYTIVPVPYDNIRIAFANGVFTITDTDGTSYIFGASGNTYDGSLSPVFREQIGLTITGWKCRSVTNASNTETISFTYQDKATETYITRSGSIEYYNRQTPPDCLTGYITADKVQAAHPGSYSYEQLTSYYPFHMLSSPKYIEHFPDRPSVFHLPFVRYDAEGIKHMDDYTYPSGDIHPGNGTSTVVQGIALSKIEFNGGSVEFSGTNQLNSIQVKHSDNSLLRSFAFYHTPINTGYQDVRPTLYLDAVHIINNNGEVNERYHLLYKTKQAFGEVLVGKDAWGYPNAFTYYYGNQFDGAPESFIPHQDITQPFYYNCYSNYDNITFSIGNPFNAEQVDREGSQRGILRRIVYPTGGYVNFDFESNKYKEEGAGSALSVQMGGGLRIRAITYYDGKSYEPVSQKYYRYGELEDGIGLAVHAPPKTFDGASMKYNAYSYTQDILYARTWDDYIGSPCSTPNCVDIVTTETKTTYMPASSQSYTYSNGAPVYYTKVTEYNSDLGKETGKTVHTFYPPNEFTQLVPNKIPGTNIDYLRSDGLMGRQQFIKEYAYRNGHYFLKHSKEFQYTKYSQPAMVKVVFAFNRVDVRIVEGNYIGPSDELYGPNKFGNFSTGQYGIEVGKLLLTGETEKWLSDAGTLTQQTTYQYNNANYQQPSVIKTTNSDGKIINRYLKYCYDFPDPVYTQMLAKNMISQLIEDRVEVASTGMPISTTKTNYAAFPGNFIAPQSVQKSYGGGPVITEIQYDIYDNKANLLQSTGRDGIVTSYIWGYQQKNLLAKIAGLGYVAATTGIDVAALQTVTGEDQLRTVFNNLRTSHPSSLISSFTHKPLTGISSKTDPSGLTQFFEYDGAGRLMLVKNNNQEILQSYKYSYETVSPSSIAFNTTTSVTPVMESFNKTGSNNEMMVYNYTVPGWILDGEGEQYQPAEKDGLAVANVLVNLNAWFEQVPTGFYLDLLKDGSVVYSKRFKYKQDHSPVQLYIPQGEYQVNLRVDENFDNGILNNHFYSPAGAGQPENDFMINGPVTVNFVPGITYNITSFNF